MQRSSRAEFRVPASLFLVDLPGRVETAFCLLQAMTWSMILDPGAASANALLRRSARCLTMGTEIAILTCFVGGVPERSKGTDCKSVGSAFEGSNPSPSTNH